MLLIVLIGCVGELLALLNADKVVKRTVSGSHPYRISPQAVTKVTRGNIAVNIKTTVFCKI